MNVTMDGVPPGGFIVQIVEGYAAFGRGAEFAHEVCHPIACPGRADHDAREVRIVAGNVGLIGMFPVAAVGVVGVKGILTGVSGCREAARSAVLCHPAEYVHRAQGLGSNGSIGGDLGVELSGVLLTGGASPIFKVPVAGGVGYVRLVVVTGGGVSAKSIDGNVGCLACGGGKVERIPAVDVRVDGVGLRA